MDDWYNITVKEFHQAGGGTLFPRYGSMVKLLTTLYPEYPDLTLPLTSSYNWDMSKFRMYIDHVARGYWDNMDNQRRKMEEISSKLRILISTVFITRNYYS